MDKEKQINELNNDKPEESIEHNKPKIEEKEYTNILVQNQKTKLSIARNTLELSQSERVYEISHLPYQS